MLRRLAACTVTPATTVPAGCTAPAVLSANRTLCLTACAPNVARPAISEAICFPACPPPSFMAAASADYVVCFSCGASATWAVQGCTAPCPAGMEAVGTTRCRQLCTSSHPASWCHPCCAGCCMGCTPSCCLYQPNPFLPWVPNSCYERRLMPRPFAAPTVTHLPTVPRATSTPTCPSGEGSCMGMRRGAGAGAWALRAALHRHRPLPCALPQVRLGSL